MFSFLLFLVCACVCLCVSSVSLIVEVVIVGMVWFILDLMLLLLSFVCRRQTYAMLAHQDYPGAIEFLVLDGKCTSESTCNSELLGSPSTAFTTPEAKADRRLRYYFSSDEFIADQKWEIRVRFQITRNART